MTALRKILIPLLLFVIFGGALSACAPAKKAGAEMDMSKMKMAPLSQMPADVQKASKTTQDAYRFNVANADMMKQIPCYCGCGDMGHTSNYSCYVKKEGDGKITFESHALGCSICVDITQDAMRMSVQNKTPGEIKSYVDATYSKYGPSNIK
jgi:hypothetical protein